MKNKSGFTLIELALAAAILGTTMISLLGIYIGCLRSIEVGKDTAIAMRHAYTVHEQIRAINDPDDVVAEDWTTWADNNFLEADENKLKNESISVTYPSGTSAMPLQILITASWKDVGGGDKSVELATLLMERKYLEQEL